MPIVRLKTERDRKVNELLKSFGLPHIDYPNGYEAKPRPELVGGSASAMNPTEALGLKAVNELLRWIRRPITITDLA
jgi:hypothetical protein